jgi:polysaccharide export outer membrane protein
MLKALAVPLLICALVCGAHAQAPFAPTPVTPPADDPRSSAEPPAPRNPDAATDTNVAHETLLIGPGDLLQITVLDESDLSRKVRVRDSGEITIPFIGSVQVGGLNTAEASTAIARKYIDGQFLRHPEVSVFVEEYSTQSVSVLGQVVHPGPVSISTGRSLVDVIAMAGGLTDVADRHITIERGGASRGLVEVFLSNRAEDAFNANVEVLPGDKILVPKAGIVYVLGDVGRPGGYVMQNNSRMTVLQAVAMAAGVNRTGSEAHARIIHNSNGKFQERELPLKEIEAGTAPDELLQADDVIYIPFSFGKNVLMGTNSIVAATSSALIYAGR